MKVERIFVLLLASIWVSSSNEQEQDEDIQKWENYKVSFNSF